MACEITHRPSLAGKQEVVVKPGRFRNSNQHSDCNMIITSVERIPASGIVYLKKCWPALILCDHLDRSISPVVSSPEIPLFMSIF